MSNCVQILSDENGIQVCFDIQQEKVMAIGEEMNAIQEEAYMNGENWDIFLQYYLAELAAVITSLLEHPEEIYRILQEAGDEIEWD